MQHVVVAQYNADHFRVEQRDSTPQFPFQSEKNYLSESRFSLSFHKDVHTDHWKFHASRSFHK